MVKIVLRKFYQFVSVQDLLQLQLLSKQVHKISIAHILVFVFRSYEFVCFGAVWG